MKKLEALLAWGGTRREIACLAVSGAALLVSIFDLVPLPFDADWIAIVLCGILQVSIIARLVNRHLDRTAPFGPGGDTVTSDPAGRGILKTILRRFQRERVGS